VIGDAEVVEPRPLLVELDPGRTEVEAGKCVDPDSDLGESGEERERAGGLARPRQQPDDERGGQGKQNQDRGQPVVH
jgi:hypothetical protein